MSRLPSDNIDIKSVLSYLGAFKGFILAGIAYFAGLIKKHWLAVLVPIIAATAFGGYRFTQMEPLHHLEMQLTFNELYKRTYGEMILRLDEQLQQNNRAYVAKELGMEENEVELIASLSALNIARSPLHEDVSEEKLPFYVLADVRDNSIAVKLQKGLIHYLKNNPLNIERRRINLINLQDRLSFLEEQLAWMDSIKVNYNRQLQSGVKSDQLTNEMSIDKLFALSDTFYKEWLGVRSGLDSYEAIELVLGFTPQENATKPSIQDFLLKYVFIGFAFSLVIVLWLAIPSSEG